MWMISEHNGIEVVGPDECRRLRPGSISYRAGAS